MTTATTTSSLNAEPLTLEEVKALIGVIQGLLGMCQQVSRALSRGSIAEAQAALCDGVDQASEVLGKLDSATGKPLYVAED